jgi:cell division protease FtsH
LLNAYERKVIAHHELGHAIVAMALPGTDTVHKVSIIPRGVGALGYTIQRPTEDRFLMSSAELENKIAVLLGGRAAEHIVFGNLSTGAADDLAKATEIAHAMATRFGMTDELGQMAYETDPAPLLGGPAVPNWQPRRYSEQTAAKIDLAVRSIIAHGFGRAVGILGKNRPLLDRWASTLLSRETLGAAELRDIAADLHDNDTPAVRLALTLPAAS